MNITAIIYPIIIWSHLTLYNHYNMKINIHVSFLRIRDLQNKIDDIQGGPLYTGMMVGGRHVGIEHALDVGDMSQIPSCNFYETQAYTCNPSGTVIDPCHYCKTEVVYIVSSAKCPGDHSFPPSLAPLYMWILKPYNIKKHFGKQYLCAVEPNPSAKFASLTSSAPVMTSSNVALTPPQEVLDHPIQSLNQTSQGNIIIITIVIVVILLLLCGLGIYLF
ncbi:hypothetical protein ACR3K2_00620 [Cryptosporidium serpentis]